MQDNLDFDDVLIRPIPSEVNSRSDVDISIEIENLELQFPLIASPMRGIVNAEFAKKLSDLGGLAILHRFYDSNEERINEIKSMNGYKYGAAISLNDNDFQLIVDLQPNIICVDLANAYTKDVLNFCATVRKYIDKYHYDTLLMSGNVATVAGCRNLRDSGVEIIRYGIGGGGLCSTRNVTGIGVPQISALQDVVNFKGAFICSDGGIRNSGDFVKSIVAGAEFAMAGSLFGQTYESPSKDTIYGMASQKLNEMMYTQIKSIEGIEKAIEKKWSLKQFVDEFSWGIRSAGTYLNARNLNEIRTNGQFVLSGTGSIKKL